MPYISFILASLCCLACLATSSPSRMPEEAPKGDGPSSPTGELDPPIADQLGQALLASSEEDPEKRGWHKLSNVWGKRDWNRLNGLWGKRDWNKLNGMWGKRENNELPPYWGKRGWNNLSNVWGKRGWNNLSNVWGKRGWNNLSGVWGKRTAGRDDDNKRTSQWNNLKSVWGKRDADWDVPAVWETLPATDNFPGYYVPEQM